jgi:hypothetical protein
MANHKLVALKVDRRSVAAAVFSGRHLDYVQERQLATHPAKAEASTLGFVNWIVATFEIESVALEKVHAGTEIRRGQLAGAIRDTLRQSGISIWEFSKQDLFAAFGVPPLKSRRELREVTLAVWPILDGGSEKMGILDAAALGLFVQTERLLLTGS